MVHGSQLEDGRSYEEGMKYRTAVSLGNGVKLDGKKTRPHDVSIMSEQEFLGKYQIETTEVEVPRSSSSGSGYPVSHPGELSSEATGKCTIPGPENGKIISCGQLWAEKWRPEKAQDILGNGEAVRKLLAWLQNWYDTCILGKKNEAPRNRFGEPERVRTWFRL